MGLRFESSSSRLQPRSLGPGVSAVIPVYGSTDSLRDLVRRLDPRVVQEVILVDDSRDDVSWGVIRELCDEDERVNGIRLMRNFGQHPALLCGIRAVTRETIVTLDDDLQHPPEEIPRLLDRLVDGVDVVYGYPRREQHGVFRDASSLLIKRILRRLMGLKQALEITAFRAFRARLRDAFAEYNNPNVAIDVLLSWGARGFAAVPVEHARRARGRSGYTLWKLVGHAVTMVTAFSVIPLRLASLFGLACSVFGALLLLWVLGRYAVEGTAVPGFPLLASSIAIFSGVQLFAIGVAGEYIGKIFQSSLHMPCYVVRAEADITSDDRPARPGPAPRTSPPATPSTSVSAD